MKLLKRLAAFTVALGLVFVGNEFYREHRVSNHMGEVHFGMSKDQVQVLLGGPSYIVGCAYWALAMPDCAEVFTYRDAFAPLLPAYHVIVFDKSGRVISTARLVSP